MDTDRARVIITAYVREQFGRVLDVREVNVVRRASGRTFQAELVCPTRKGEIPVGVVGVGEDGQINLTCTIDDLVEALQRTKGAVSLYPPMSTSTPPQTAEPSAEASFADLMLDDALEGVDAPILSVHPAQADDPELEEFFANFDAPDLRDQVRQLKSSGQREDLLNVRSLLPRLLTQPDGRGSVLMDMADVELRLGEKDLALEYLEAAAREFADRSEMRSLEKVASTVHGIVGEEAFASSQVKMLLDHCRRRLRPIEHIEQAPVFANLDGEMLFFLDGAARLTTIRQGDQLLREGDPAVRAFVVKSGVVSVRLEAPDGGSRLVRCCFPGDLIGESSVLGATGATCTATVVAECLTTLWAFEGDRLRALLAQSTPLRSRLESARALHRLDSFFSMNETTKTLDARVRDRLLGCLTGIRRVVAGDTLIHHGALPLHVFLVAEGRVQWLRDEGEPIIFGPDSFVGMRDALHELPADGDYVAAAESRLLCFDPVGLRSLVADAPVDVAAVIERL